MLFLQKNKPRRYRFLWLVVVVIIIVIIFIVRPLFFSLPYSETISIEIEPGKTNGSIAMELERQHLISSPWLFYIFGKVSGQEGSIKAGSFEVDKGMSVSALYRLLTDAGLADEEITIPEGWTMDDIASELDTRGFVDAERFGSFASTLSWRDEFSFLPTEFGNGNSDYQGYFFPDTYRFSAKHAESDLPRQAFKNFERKVVVGLKDDLSLSNRPLHEILTTASILQAEVRRSEDMAKVAGIIENRLKLGMALQMDSTVNFATGKKMFFTTAEDRATDSPYNTYKYAGLPAGPINNPGLDAIRAALYPEASSYYYFLTDKDGGVYYARTLEEQSANKAKYLR